MHNYLQYALHFDTQLGGNNGHGEQMFWAAIQCSSAEGQGRFGETNLLIPQEREISQGRDQQQTDCKQDYTTRCYILHGYRRENLEPGRNEQLSST
jgi:hypothetical protein